MTSVPFKVQGGWAESSGLLSLSADQLCFQFQTRDGVLGVFKSGVRDVKIDLADVGEVGFKRRWFGAGRFTVRLADMKLGEKLPGHETGLVTLIVARQHAADAQELASSANLQAAEARLMRTMNRR